MAIPLLIPLGLAAIGAAGKAFARAKANKDLDKVLQESQKPLGLAQSLFNARMAGAADYEKNILSSQGNILDYIRKNATDSSQAIAAATGTGGQTQEALNKLRIEEAQNKYNLADFLKGAYENYAGTLAQVKGAQAQNRAATLGDVMNIGESLIPFTKQFQNLYGNFGMNKIGGMNMNMDISKPSLYSQPVSTIPTGGNSLPGLQEGNLPNLDANQIAQLLQGFQMKY